MSPFYYNLYEHDYQEYALNRAIELFFSFSQEKKELVYKEIKAKYGSENSDFVRKNAESISFLNEALQYLHKEQILSCILPLVETQEAIELISLKLQSQFYKNIPDFQHIDYELSFNIAFFEALEPVQKCVLVL